MDFGARGSTSAGTDGRLRMPFGKHRGLPLEEVPADYLAWLLDNVDLGNRPTLRAAIRLRLGLDRPPGAGPPYLEATIKAWYRRLALDFHPDRRKGSPEAMIAINEAHDRLREALGL